MLADLPIQGYIVKIIKYLISLSLWFVALCSQAAWDNTQLAVWANEAMVATYTFDSQNLIARQREIAQYFTAQGWLNYSKALTASKLLDTVQKNSYFVSAVALLPPEIKTLGPQQWQATMPLLVLYKNPQYQQKQTLQVTMDFAPAPSTSEGVRGLVVTSLITTVTTDPCPCQPE